jgi:hypothetical protein
LVLEAEDPAVKARDLTLATTLRVRYDPQQDDPVALEQAIAAEGRRAARDLYLELADTVESACLLSTAGARQRQEERWVATLMGRIRLRRYRVKADGRTSHPLDELLQLGQAEASPALLASARELTDLGLTYRQIAGVLTHFTGDPIAPQTAWRMLRTR